ncbi:sugar kinase [Schleiferilactobacillus shenzhenensis]|uniref:KdgK n=1 Tax=Schleiferilactobacillus shenzhenensis LY-73 TaxID=1231336 RepID=U4TLR8_9LACO|nr:sugar kinase [Schleiferilactobacillus shenzhenensis]ERL65164.1 KdgK [Schleiferilactobacillus shenzhenensis LY-73]
MDKVLTMGEMMLRLKPPEYQRILQADSFAANYGGSEANVAVSLALLGDNAAYLTKLPDNALGDTALATVRKYGVDTRLIRRGGPRLGIYFFEKGTSVRGTNVVYDRAGSSFALARADEFDWPTLLAGVTYFYFSGITAALSAELRTALLAACQYCQAHDITVVCDVNYRGKMWSPAEAQAAMAQLMPFVNICIANDEDFAGALGIDAFDGDMTRGIEQKDSFVAAMQSIQKQYPSIHTVASVVRDMPTADDNTCTALLVQGDGVWQGRTYHVHVMEGVASGDAFGAALVHGLINGFAPQELIDYASTASVLKLTIHGDLNIITDADIRKALASSSNVSR